MPFADLFIQTANNHNLKTLFYVFYPPMLGILTLKYKIGCLLVSGSPGLELQAKIESTQFLKFATF